MDLIKDTPVHLVSCQVWSMLPLLYHIPYKLQVVPYNYWHFWSLHLFLLFHLPRSVLSLWISSYLLPLILILILIIDKGQVNYFCYLQTPLYNLQDASLSSLSNVSSSPTHIMCHYNNKNMIEIDNVMMGNERQYSI